MDITNTPYTVPCVTASTQLPAPDTLSATMKQWATKYAKYKWCILQVYGLKNDLTCCCTKSKGCRTPGKHPVELGWQDSATYDLKVIDKWDWKNRNIGIITGLVSDLYLIDQDVKPGGPNGVDNLAEWESENVTLFPKFIVATGGGGLHYYFPYPKDWKSMGSSMKPLPGVDIKSDGGFVVAPPSRHYSGGKYVWGV